MTARVSQPVLVHVRAELERFYGDRLEAILLFGSRARGDATADSDYDVAVVLRDYDGGLREVLELADLSAALLMDMGAFVSAKPFSPSELQSRTLFMHNLVRDAVPL